MLRVFQQRIKCIGCGNCVEVASNTWIMNKADGKADLIGAKENKGFFTLLASDDEYQNNLEAEKICPVKIIRIEKINK
jgi:ferredoxin